MKELPDLKQLSNEAKDALIVALWEELQKLRQGERKQPKKTSKNSSLPPAKGFKAQVKDSEKESEEKRVGSLGRECGGSGSFKTQKTAEQAGGGEPKAVAGAIRGFGSSYFNRTPCRA
ncbi:MAG: hypothetical protein LH702_33360 [Phormidesmis sp. CAN_BIN44]|nr:hypothetical protein [Phormidesmis sp. CAN_BIN44]